MLMIPITSKYSLLILKRFFAVQYVHILRTRTHRSGNDRKDKTLFSRVNILFNFLE